MLKPAKRVRIVSSGETQVCARRNAFEEFSKEIEQFCYEKQIEREFVGQSLELEDIIWKMIDGETGRQTFINVREVILYCK